MITHNPNVVYAATPEPLLIHLINCEVTHEFAGSYNQSTNIIEIISHVSSVYIQSHTFDIIDHACSTYSHVCADWFCVFIETVIQRGEVTTSAALLSLLYIRRAKDAINVTTDSVDVDLRIFLGAIIVASKFLNDVVMRNWQWSACAGIFTVKSINTIEREFLDILDWKLNFTQSELLIECMSLIEEVPQLLSCSPHIQVGFDNCGTQRTHVDHSNPSDESNQCNDSS
ncbi:hypothetical protein EV359DRAFT_42867 [Lentinula novae-zelandiae]|nr:hypothetical protein EV359DRAFT_42867 [Lentinula novae-zelandiae]